jgi:predicted CXXCH cytochrome family protein
MFRKLILRICISLGFALPLAFAFTAAGKSAPIVTQTDECGSCHDIIRNHWSESGHGQAFDDPVFQQEWAAQGQPDACLSCHTSGFDITTGEWDAPGVTCTTCHYPTPGNHPEQIMPTDVSSRLCGNCHLDTYAEWSDSVHGQEDLACVRCHNPHTTSLKADDAQQLCAACHSDEVHFFSLTAHAEAGLLCTDCHLSVSDQTLGDGHGQRVHTFEVNMDSCSTCHEDAMHYPVDKTAAPAEAEPVTTMGLLPDTASLAEEPAPVSPAGFAVLAALLGAAFGLVLAPWIERWFRRLNP